MDTAPGPSPSDTAREEAGQEVISRAFTALERGDFEAAGRDFADDFVMEWPQTGEIFRGRDAAFAAMEAHPEKPEFEGEPRIVGAGDWWVIQATLRYPSGIAHYVNVVEIRGDKVAHATEYWARPEAAAIFSDKMS